MIDFATLTSMMSNVFMNFAVRCTSLRVKFEALRALARAVVACDDNKDGNGDDERDVCSPTFGANSASLKTPSVLSRVPSAFEAVRACCTTLRVARGDNGPRSALSVLSRSASEMGLVKLRRTPATVAALRSLVSDTIRDAHAALLFSANTNRSFCSSNRCATIKHVTRSPLRCTAAAKRSATSSDAAASTCTP